MVCSMNDAKHNPNELERSRIPEFLRRYKVAVGVGVVMVAGVTIGFVEAVQDTIERNKNFDFGDATEQIYEKLQQQSEVHGD